MTQNQKGMTLVEVMLASFVIMVSVLGASTIGNLIYSTSSVLTSSNARDGVRSEINRNLTNNSVWRSTYMDINNTSMTCLRDRTDCSGVSAMANRSFRIVKFGGEVIYDPSANGGLAGFNRQGVKCNAATDGLFDATNGNYKCPLRYDLSWRPLCPPSGVCIDPIVEISASVSVKSTANDKMYTIDYDLTDPNNRLNFKMLLPMPQSAPPIARTDSFIINRGETPLFDVLANDFVEEGYTLTLVSVTSTNGWVSISGNKIQYSPDPIYYGTDSLRYVVQDNSGKKSTGYVFVKIMTPYTWTGLAGNTDITNPQNWCGTVINGVCQGRSLVAKADLIFNENCTNCNAKINSSLTVSSLRMTKGFTGTIEQNANLNAITSGAARSSEDIAPYGYTFMQEAGTYKINSGDFNVFGSWLNSDFINNMISLKVLGGSFVASSANKITATPSLVISEVANFQLNDAPVYLEEAEGHFNFPFRGIDAPNINFKDLHIKTRGQAGFWSKIEVRDLFWEQPAPSTGSYGTSYYCDKTVVTTHRNCNCTVPNDTASKINGFTCPESIPTANNTGEIAVTNDLHLLGGGGIDAVWAANAEKPARIFMRGASDTNIIGDNQSSTIKAVLPQIFIDKNNATSKVNLSGVITFVDRFEIIKGVIVAGNNSTVRFETRQYHHPVLDLKGAELWNLDMNEGSGDANERWANVNSDVIVNGALRFPSVQYYAASAVSTGGGVNYGSNCGAIYAKGDVYLGSSHSANHAFARNAICATSISSSGTHVLDVVLTGNANQNIFQTAGTTPSFGNLYIQKAGGIANFNAGSYGLVGDLNISCTSCTNFFGSTLFKPDTYNAERAPRVITNGETLGSIVFTEFPTSGGYGPETQIVGDLHLSGSFTAKLPYVRQTITGSKIFIGGDFSLSRVLGGNRWSSDFTVQFNGSVDQNLNIDNTLYGYPSTDKLENHLFVEVNKASGQVVLQANLKAKTLTMTSGTLNRNAYSCDSNGVACSGATIIGQQYPDFFKWMKNLNSAGYPHTLQSSYNMRIDR